MIKIIISCIIIIGGLILILCGIYETGKRAMKISIKDNNELEKYCKYMKSIDIATGIGCIILGTAAILNLVTGEQAGLIVCFICLLNRIIEFVINKRYCQQQ